MKLISMTDYVLEKVNADIPCDRGNILNSIANYANFLKQPLELCMFVPCNEDGNVLKEPTMDLIRKRPLTSEGWDSIYYRMKEEYQQAKERVLFEGFEYTDSQKYSMINKIELSVSPYGLKDEKLQITKIKDNGNFHTWLSLTNVESLVECNLTLTQSAIEKYNLL